jgi:hypothetical protein
MTALIVMGGATFEVSTGRDRSQPRTAANRPAASAAGLTK